MVHQIREGSNMKCNTCKLEKDVSEYYTNSSSKSGYRIDCKECVKAKAKDKHRTPRGLITTIYSNQLKSSTKRGHNRPEYVLNELIQWITTQDSWDELYDNWVKSGYNKEYTPSCDRLDDDIGYKFSNMRLVTWKDNALHGTANRRAGVSSQGECCKAVVQYTLSGDKIAEYVSIREASRCTGITRGLIQKVCEHHKDHKQTGGYIFRYDGDNDVEYKIKNRKVIQMSKDKIELNRFNTQKEASEKTGVSYSGIGATCRGVQQSAGGFTWEYEGVSYE